MAHMISSPCATALWRPSPFSNGHVAFIHASKGSTHRALSGVTP
jgi:hypothetical protein